MKPTPEEEEKYPGGYPEFLTRHLWWGIGCLFVIMIIVTLITTKCRAAELSTFGEVMRVSYERPSGSLWQQEFAGYPTQWDTRKTGFRLGAQYGMVRLSYFDLGKYQIHAEAGDEEDVIVACQCQTAGDKDWYHTLGSLRGFAITLRPTWKGFFFETGPGQFRQSFQLVKDDGWYFQERMWGLGYMVGLGYEHKGVSLGVYSYQTNMSGRFENGATPVGTGGATVFALGYRFL